MLKDKEGESLVGMWASRQSWGVRNSERNRLDPRVLRADDGVNHNIGSYVPRL